MRKISELAGRELKWTQPGAFKKNFELHAGDQLVGTLNFRSTFGSFATGESADGCWTFKRVGFWHARATVRVCGSETDLASFKDSTWKSGGTLTLADGRELRATTSLWKSTFEFQDQSHTSLIRFTNHGVMHMSSTVEIQHGAMSMPELPWLVMLGWYLALKKQEEAAAAAS